MQDLVNKHFYNLFIITLLFGVVLYDVIGFKSSDEICALLLLVLFVITLFRSKDWEMNKAFIVTLCIFFFYLCYSIWIGSNTRKAIVVDLIIQLKPYLALFCTYQMMPAFSEAQRKLLKQIALAVWALFLLPLGLAAMVNEQILWQVITHPNAYAAAITAVSLTYLFSCAFTWNEKLTFLLMLSIGLASGRSKFYGFFALSCFVIFYFGNPKNLHLNFRTVLTLVGMLAVIVFVAREKIIFYFAQGISGEVELDYLARMALYTTSIPIFIDFFPFGSGLASFATHASGAYYSDIYSKYGIDSVWGLSKSYSSFVADTYYPSLAQFGLVGIFLYILFWLFILRKAYVFFRKTNQVQFFSIILLIAGTVSIDNIADATFTSNRGFFMLLFIGLLLAAYKQLIREQAAETPVSEAEIQATSLKL